MKFLVLSVLVPIISFLQIQLYHLMPMLRMSGCDSASPLPQPFTYTLGELRVFTRCVLLLLLLLLVY